MSVRSDESSSVSEASEHSEPLSTFTPEMQAQASRSAQISEDFRREEAERESNNFLLSSEVEGEETQAGPSRQQVTPFTFPQALTLSPSEHPPLLEQGTPRANVGLPSSAAHDATDFRSLREQHTGSVVRGAPSEHANLPVDSFTRTPHSTSSEGFA